MEKSTLHIKVLIHEFTNFLSDSDDDFTLTFNDDDVGIIEHTRFFTNPPLFSPKFIIHCHIRIKYMYNHVCVFNQNP